MRPLMSVPLVVLRPMGEWSAGQDATVSYSTVPEFPGSAWDWIALYKVTMLLLGCVEGLGDGSALSLGTV